MPSIFLLRHCEYENPRNILPGRLPLELSEAGRVKAHELAKTFSDKNVAKIYSSAVERCKQTADIVADGKIAVIFDQRLLETLSAYQGYWGENKTADGFNFFSHRKELGGEGLADIQTRMNSFLDEITQNLHENIIVCSHGDPLQVLYSSIFNLPLVDDNCIEENIPGWLEKGEFSEIAWDGKKGTLFPKTEL